MTGIVGFAGYESEDLVLYLARILTALEKKVAIVDRTEQELMLEIFRHRLVSQGENSLKEIEYEGIWITSNTMNYEEYDVVFLLFGYRLMHPKLYECSYLILVTDGMPAHASLLQKVGQWERNHCILIRNLVPMKHGEDYLTMLAAARDWSCFVIPLSEQDIRVHCSLGSEEHIKLKHLSAELREVLVQICCWFHPEWNQKQLKRLLKKI